MESDEKPQPNQNQCWKVNTVGVNGPTPTPKQISGRRECVCGMQLMQGMSMAMAAASSIISVSSASFLSRTPTQTPHPKTQSLVKQTSPTPASSSFTTLAALKISSAPPATTLGVGTRRSRLSCSASASASSSSSTVLPSALLFDCDGVLVDTEKDGHRISFNETFQEVHTLINYHNSLLSFAFLSWMLMQQMQWSNDTNTCFGRAETTRRYLGRWLVRGIAQNWRWKRKVYVFLTIISKLIQFITSLITTHWRVEQKFNHISPS